MAENQKPSYGSNSRGGGATASAVFRMMAKMGPVEWALFLGGVFWALPAGAGFFWNAVVSQQSFDPETLRLRDGGSVGWNAGGVAADILRGADKEVRPYLQPAPSIDAAAEREAAETDITVFED